MVTPFNAALSAYNSAASLIGEAGRTVTLRGAQEQEGGFAALLAETVQGVVDSGRVADQKAMGLVNGNGDIVDVVTAISQTEMAIDTMVTVRDRVISAYEEIMRMPI